MEALIFGMLVVLAIALVAVLVRLGVLKASVDQIVPRPDVVVNAYAAMAQCPASKTELESLIYVWSKEDPEDSAMQNLSQRDIRCVFKLIGKRMRELQPDEVIGQARDMQSW